MSDDTKFGFIKNWIKKAFLLKDKAENLRKEALKKIDTMETSVQQGLDIASKGADTLSDSIKKTSETLKKVSQKIKEKNNPQN